ncbi:HAD hydrolase-like protein [Alistipes finegoldii]|uniref:HAD hydrolase-like protein n=1 Tax=Alistipes finegoldii TaxID=214856 RepID=UPI002430650F|nr:HAD hydrolase-like protein [Alistipes finegoldii]
MHWKYLLFDLDGTLTDPMQGITRSVQYALRHFGIEVEDLTTLCPFIGPPLRDSFREFYGMTSAQADEASEKYGEYFSRQGIFENKLYAGIPELLSALQAQGATLAIATSKPDFLAERIARHFGFRDRFTLICGGTAYGPCSTKAGVIRETLAQLRIDDPSQAVMIGDRRFDIEGAVAAGVESIGVLWGYGSREELEKASPGYLAADIPELRRLLA